MEYHSVTKKNKTIPSSTLTQIEISILSGTKWNKSERERQIPCDITYMWNIKYNTNESIYETESWT